MTDLIARLRRLYVEQGTSYVQEAADRIEAQDAGMDSLKALLWKQEVAVTTLTKRLDDAQRRALDFRDERDRLRDALADKVTRDTMLTGMTTGSDGLRIGLEGGAASLLAEMLAQQFKDGGGVNYLEVSFVSRTALPGEAFIVNVQRVQGKSPHTLRAEAEAERDRLREELERARVDAERWRFFCNRFALHVQRVEIARRLGVDDEHFEPNLDAAIDAAMRKPG